MIKRRSCQNTPDKSPNLGNTYRKNWRTFDGQTKSRSAEKEDIQKFTELARDFSEPGDKEKADAVLQVSVAANREKYDEVRRSENMCEALRELMKEEIEEELKKNREKSLVEGHSEGETQAKKEMAYELYHEEGFSIERIAKLVKQDRETVEQWLQEKTTA